MRRVRSGPAPSVDELFARIRAGTAKAQAPAPAPRPRPSGRRRRPPSDVADGGAGRAEPAKADAAGVTDAGGATGRRRCGRDRATSPREATEAEPAVEPGPDAFIIARRDDLLTPITRG